jgi:arabinose-5-phosphate isomerase
VSLEIIKKVKQTHLQINISQELISVISKEIEALNSLVKNFPHQAEILVEKILQTNGRVVFSGMGKSGHVAKKLVATFAGLGIQSMFLHPAESLHGDLGMINSQDLFIAISKSGTGIELEQIIPVLKSQGNFCCLISCVPGGALTKLVDLSIVLPFTAEACELNLAPTSSSTLCMAFGDALAVVVSKIKGFGKNDFAKLHPSGALGKKLLLKVASLMAKGDLLALIYPETNFKDLLLKITNKKLGVGIVVDQKNILLGIITDGDLRRACELGPKVFEKTAKDIMKSDPKMILQETLAYDALQFMEQFNITSLVVTDQNKKVVGLIHIHDLIKAGIS